MASALLEAAEAPPDPAEGAWFIEACAVFTLTCTLTRSIGPGTKIIIFVLVLSQQMSIKNVLTARSFALGLITKIMKIRARKEIIFQETLLAVNY